MANDPVDDAITSFIAKTPVSKRRKWKFSPPEPVIETKVKRYNPPRSSNDNRKRTGPDRRPVGEDPRLIEIRIYDDKDVNTEGHYQGSVRIPANGRSAIVYLKRAYVRGAPKRGRAGGTGSKRIERFWYVAGFQYSDG